MDSTQLKYLLDGIREELAVIEAHTDFVLDNAELISELRCFYALIIVENNRR